LTPWRQACRKRLRPRAAAVWAQIQTRWP
jgi:hypothetical protein